MKVIYNNKEVANTTLNYNELFNKPLLNSHELVGNTSLNDIGVYSKPQVDNLIASTRSIKVVSALPTPLVANTMYYVGPDQNNLYHIYLVDSSLTLIDLGMSQDAVYLGGNGIDISSDNEISVVFDNETLMLNSEGELYVRPATENVEGVVSYDNVSIKKNSSGKIYVPTTKSGDRFGVYPFTNSAGNTEIGKAIGFYTNDSDTGWKGELRLDETNHQLVFGDYTTSPSTSKPIVTGETTTSGNRWGVYPYTDNGGITAAGQAIDFYTSDTATGGSARLQFYPSSHKLVLGDYSQSPAAVSTVALGDTVGNTGRPVYVDNGIIKAVNVPIPGSYFNTVPFIRNSGIMDVGKGFDFHGTSTTTASTEGSLSLNTTTGDLQWVNRLTSGPSRDGFIITSGMMSQMPEVIEATAVTTSTVTTWKGNSYGVNIAANGINLTSGASGVRRVKGTVALYWSSLQNPGNFALAPISGTGNNYLKLMSGLTASGTVTPSMVTFVKNGNDWATASFAWGTVEECIVWYDAIRINSTSWHIDFTISILGSQACLSGTVLTRNIAADATPRIYIGNVSTTPTGIAGILEIYR